MVLAITEQTFHSKVKMHVHTLRTWIILRNLSTLCMNINLCSCKRSDKLFANRSYTVWFPSGYQPSHYAREKLMVHEAALAPLDDTYIYYVYGLLVLIKITLVKWNIRVSRNVKVHCNKIHGLLTDNVVIR